MYINTTTSAYPLTDRDVMAAFPNVSFPSPFVAPDGYAYVNPTQTPSINPHTQTAVETAPALVDGVWTQQWEIVAIDAGVIESDWAAAKAAKNLQINLWRAAANKTFFTHGGKQIACDALSRSDIDAVAGHISLFGTFPAGFPNAWKATDNTYLSLPNVEAFKDMYASMTLRGTINFGQSQALKIALAAATTIEEVNAITWG